MALFNFKKICKKHPCSGNLDEGIRVRSNGSSSTSLEKVGRVREDGHRPRSIVSEPLENTHFVGFTEIMPLTVSPYSFIYKSAPYELDQGVQPEKERHGATVTKREDSPPCSRTEARDTNLLPRSSQNEVLSPRPAEREHSSENSDVKLIEVKKQIPVHVRKRPSRIKTKFTIF